VEKLHSTAVAGMVSGVEQMNTVGAHFARGAPYISQYRSVCLFLSTTGLLHKVNDAGVLHEELYASETAVHVMQHEQAVSSKATSRYTCMK
jgi:hypothetical protein